jgi:hypothetical protein
VHHHAGAVHGSGSGIHRVAVAFKPAGCHLSATARAALETPIAPLAPVPSPASATIGKTGGIGAGLAAGLGALGLGSGAVAFAQFAGGGTVISPAIGGGADGGGIVSGRDEGGPDTSVLLGGGSGGAAPSWPADRPLFGAPTTLAQSQPAPPVDVPEPSGVAALLVGVLLLVVLRRHVRGR